MKKSKNIIRGLLNHVAEFFPYFLGFYVLSLIIALFSEPWRVFFYWRVFNVSFIILAILIIFSEKFRSMRIWKRIRKIRWRKILSWSSISNTLFNKKRLQFKKVTYFKLGFIPLILLYSIFKDIHLIEFIILSFGLISIFFIIDSRIAAGVALFFLVACPILLSFSQNSLAETFAVYAYYFLVITVTIQIRELYPRKRKNILSIKRKKSGLSVM